MNGQNVFQLLQTDMEECFQKSCQLIQSEVKINATMIWGELQSVLFRLLENTEIMQKQHKKGEVQYLVFSFLRYGIYLDKLEIRIDILDDKFYLDEEECAEYYNPTFLQNRYLEDLEILYAKARKKIIRLQNYELMEIKDRYAVFYNAVLYEMLKNMLDLIVKMLIENEVNISNKLMILYGGYMDRTTVFYKRETQENEILFN